MSKGPSRLKCSFCGKSAQEVSKLLAGPDAHICNVCVSACNRILEATPDAFEGWESMPEEQLLATLKPAAASLDAMREVLQAHVETLRDRGVSWGAIGGALGVSRQAAWERFS